MRRLSTQLACVAFSAMLLAAAGARAHHAFAASFDVNQPIELRGKVSKVELINPHSWIHIDVADESGQVSTWRIEGGSPNALFRNGVTKNSVPLGAELHIVGYRARDGSLRAVGRDITFGDGRALFFGGSQPQLPGEQGTAPQQ
jgi:hypothetical protein